MILAVLPKNLILKNSHCASSKREYCVVSKTSDLIPTDLRTEGLEYATKPSTTCTRHDAWSLERQYGSLIEYKG